MHGGARRLMVALALAVLVLGAVDVGAEPPIVERRDIAVAPGAALDAFLPAEATAPVPAVLFVHGGGWRTGDKASWATWARAFVRRTGWAAFTVNYDLEATRPYATQPENVRAAIGWVRSHASSLHVDGHRIGLLGSSAGGHLAMLVATTSSEGDHVSAVVSWSGVADLPRLARSARGEQRVKDLAARYAGGRLDAQPGRWYEASPVNHVDRADPPMLLIGSADETMVPVDQVTAMGDALRAHGIAAETRILPGTRHASAFGADVWDETVDFLVDHV